MTQNSFQMISSAVSDRGLSKKRPQNEDSYLEMPEHGIFAVADGVGGAQAGDVASQMAMEMIAEAFTNLPDGGDVEELMHVAITRANGAIYQMSHDLPQLSTMATTIVALQVTGNIATIGHAGDSRLYRLDSTNSLFRETQDHSVVEEEVRAGRMTAEQAENHPSKNVISRALGAESTVEIDMKTIMFEPNTTFLLCSDGVTRHIRDVEIQELLSLPHAPVLICQQIKDICYERGAEDNLTAVIIRLSGSETGQVSDIEESTVAAARDHFAETEPDYGEIPTQNLQMPAGAEAYQPQSLPESSQSPASAADADLMIFSSNGPSAKNDSFLVEKDQKSDVDDEPRRTGFWGKFLIFLLGLILGGILGGLGYYLYTISQTPEKLPELTQMESPNIPFTAFETNRRNVDSEPQKYITAAEAATTPDSGDFYLLARALMLIGKYPEARDALGKAKQRLVEFKGDKNEKGMLTNELAILLSVAKNELSIRELEKEKNKIVISPPPSNTVNGKSNGNVSGNTNANKSVIQSK